MSHGGGPGKVAGGGFRKTSNLVELAKTNTKILDLQSRIRKWVETRCGFSDAKGSARKLEAHFKFVDRTNSGIIDYSQFFTAMTKLNFIGCQREIEALFNIFDDDLRYILYLLTASITPAGF